MYRTSARRDPAIVREQESVSILSAVSLFPETEPFFSVSVKGSTVARRSCQPAIGAMPTMASGRMRENRASKTEVRELRVPDPLEQRKAIWNNSTASGSRFPDRPMMRQLSAYDSLKRADVNLRSEVVDSVDKTQYYPHTSKLHLNERTLDLRRLQHPHRISRVEFPNHPNLMSKPRWDPSTGHGGDQYGADKLRDLSIERETAWAMEYSRQHPPKRRHETLLQREEIFMAEKREAIREARMGAFSARASTAPASMTGTSSGSQSARQLAHLTSLGHTVHQGFGVLELPPLPADQRVPCKKVTTWSLGGF
jgi:hypothetical protein